jgi:hypothetical protein
LTGSVTETQYPFVLQGLAPEARGAPFSRQLATLVGAAAAAFAGSYSLSFDVRLGAAVRAPWTCRSQPIFPFTAVQGGTVALDEQTIAIQHAFRQSKEGNKNAL